MSTRASTARHVRQRKLNTKQPLRIIREDEIEETLDEEVQRQNIHQVETGVEKGEEVEFHLQAVINAAVGTKAEQTSYIPTPDAVRAKDVRYEALYPKAFRQPATYIRFSSTVEDCVGPAYCMDEEDHKFLTQQLHHGRDAANQPIKDFAKLVGSNTAAAAACTEDVFEEAMNFFEESSLRLQPFATVIPLDSVAGGAPATPILSLEELEQAREEDDPPLSAAAQKFLPWIYPHWVSRKTAAASRPLVPAIKVRLLDTTSEADDADPYVCFRRREVRQTRKTRGRDAQIVEKLKKLRLELEQARNLVQMVRQREELNKTQLELSRKVFDERRKLKEVKVSKGIKGENGEDELLLVNQKPAPKPKASRRDTQQEPASAGGNGAAGGVAPRPATIRLRSLGDRPSASAPEDNLILLADHHAEAETYVTRSIDSRKEQHRRWNHHWHDRTWNPITPPPESEDEDEEGRRERGDEATADHLPGQQQQQQQRQEEVHRAPKWAPLFVPPSGSYPTPPPSHKSGSPVDGDGDVEMSEAQQRGESKQQQQRDHDDSLNHHAASSQLHLIRAFSAQQQQQQPLHAYFAMDNTTTATSDHKNPSSSSSHLNTIPPPPPPACRIRYGRGGRRYLEARRTRSTRSFNPANLIRRSSGVISDSDSDADDVDDDIHMDKGLSSFFPPSTFHQHHHQRFDYHPVPDYKIFEYRTMMNRGSGGAAGGAAAAAAANAAAAAAAAGRSTTTAADQQQQQQQQQAAQQSTSAAGGGARVQASPKQVKQQQPPTPAPVVAATAGGDKKA